MTLVEDTPAHVVSTLRRLVSAEATAEAPGTAMEAGDLEQAVWVRLLERLDGDGPPPDAARWVKSAVRAEARRARRTAARELPYGHDPSADPAGSPEGAALRAERCRTLWAAVAHSG